MYTKMEVSYWDVKRWWLLYSGDFMLNNYL